MDDIKSCNFADVLRINNGVQKHRNATPGKSEGDDMRDYIEKELLRREEERERQ